MEGVRGEVERGEGRSWKGSGEKLEGVRGGVGRGEGRSWHRLIITLFGNEQNGCHLKCAIILHILNSQQQYMSAFATVLCFKKIYRNIKLHNQTKSYT